MVFFETDVFTKQIVDLLPDDEYMRLQGKLVKHPRAGAVIQGGGGIRKLRWAVEGSGKRGGIRVIYYHVAADDSIFMLLAYSKTGKDDLTSQQKKILAKLVREQLL
ncbi:MAG: type II toxin-antitoxin system RelE/ParE family toxin [Sedimentisphaerales bacterium]|jgi:hypothetical protein|nr:type II toxin-antitoxin system RelE/ParE family toxin [Sedimentisphaerales bacterium]NLT75081.1 type II toxin-antitoxin system RelE/ParE family toxin [Planctomycetota bacterium]